MRIHASELDAFEPLFLETLVLNASADEIVLGNAPRSQGDTLRFFARNENSEEWHEHPTVNQGTIAGEIVPPLPLQSGTSVSCRDVILAYPKVFLWSPGVYQLRADLQDRGTTIAQSAVILLRVNSTSSQSREVEQSAERANRDFLECLYTDRGVPNRFLSADARKWLSGRNVPSGHRRIMTWLETLAVTKEAKTDLALDHATAKCFDTFRSLNLTGLELEFASCDVWRTF